MRHLLAAALLGASVVAPAAATNDDYFRYNQRHVANPASYAFYAAADGDLTVFNMNSTGSYLTTLGAIVNGNVIASGAVPLGTRDFTATTLGRVSAGDSIAFFIDAYDRGSGAHLGRYFSTIADNADGLQHVYASAFDGMPWIGVPQGTFFGFEDTTLGDPRYDLNYNDYTFVVPNLTQIRPIGAPNDGAVPEPASWAMMLAGFGAVGAAMRRRRAATAVA